MSKDRKNPGKDIADILQNGSKDDTKSFFLNSIAKFCDKCGNAFARDDIEIVKRAQGQLLLHIECSKCGSSHLASFVQQLGISSRAPFKSDLSIEELKSFSSYNAVSSNEVIDAYNYVNSQKGLNAEDFLKLLSKAEAAQPVSERPESD